MKSPKREALLNRLTWLMMGRPLLAIPLLTLILFSFHSIESTPDARLFYFLVVLRGCLTLFHFIVFRGTKNLDAFTALQLILDLFLESVLIGVTGNVESPFSILYIGTIVSSTFFFYEKGGVITATAALLLLGIVVFLKESHPSAEVASFSFTHPIFFETYYRLFLHAIAFYSVGLVSGFFFSKSHKQFKMMEEEMHQKRWLAIIGEMAAGMAHEIRNPLASLSGSIQLLKNEPSLQEENRRLMEIALHETDRLNAIITEFLLYANPNPPKRRWITLDHLLNESVELIRKSKEAAEPTQVILKMSDLSSELFVDPDQMKQVFWNLAINAFAAMPQGGTLTLTTKQIPCANGSGQKAIAFYFQDTGMGISKENLSKIFYPFFTTKSSGSGLGLSIVQRIIEQNNGAIGVESAPTGTIFKIVIPIHPRGVDISGNPVWKKS